MLLSVCLFTNLTYSATRYVPSQYTTIQAAIDACQNGDQVVVADGVYSGVGNPNAEDELDRLLVFTIDNKNIVIRSENGPEATIIDCQGSSSQHRGGFGTNYGKVEGFTIKDAYGPSAAYVIGKGAMDNCIITSNITLIDDTIEGYYGGAVFCGSFDSSIPVVSNCIITQNTVTSLKPNEDLLAGIGGGILSCWGKPLIVNCLIAENYANHGGGICCSFSSPTITNCTVINNTAKVGGGIVVDNAYDNDGVKYFSAQPKIINSIIANNIDNDHNYQLIVGLGMYDDLTAPSSATVMYSNIYGTGTNCGHDGVYKGSQGAVTWGEGNINADPKFNLYGNEWELSANSPCRDKGLNSAISGYSDDLYGNARMFNSTVDLGAIEYQGVEFSASTIPITLDTIKTSTKNGLISFSIKGTFSAQTLNGRDLYVRLSGYEEIIESNKLT